ncbi:MAG: glycoside hydrolase family 127 protein [Bacteroidales bacterium]|nr:glycoside hydrolase family 127 protein [Bacteroidales bacterium]
MRYLSLLLITGGILATNLAYSQDKLYPNEFPLGDVQLLESPLKYAQNLNIETLLKYSPDRLLAPYRKEAGLEPLDKPYPNWDGLDGHVGGHYLSAMAMNYASTGNHECKKRMEYMIAQLKECEQANIKNHPDWGNKYIGGVPNSEKIWSAFKEGNFGPYFGAWVPFYNIHKMYAGLRDAWLYCGNEDAKQMFLDFCDWGIDITSKLSDAHMETMLNNEHGGMNEMFADAFAITGDKKYIEAGKRYSHHMLLDPMSKGNDNLDNLHANTQIPKVIGFQRIGELTGDQNYLSASKYFWNNVVYQRSLAFGGNSRREHFPSAEACTDYTSDVDGPESCNSYNMLKLTEDLFRLDQRAEYADFYERTIFNHILSTQHPQHGGYVYFTSARPRHYRVYSAPNEAMWCCVGSGMENHGKYAQFIYTHNDNSLYVNLFVASTLDWKQRGISLKQETQFPFAETSKISITKGNSQFKMMIRFPKWVADNQLKIIINGKPYQFSAKPQSYVEIDRKWKKGDVVEISFPMHNSVEHMPNVPNYVAIMHGPIVLGMKTGTEDLRGIIADDSRFGQYPGGELFPIDKAPILIDDNIDNIENKLVAVEGKPLHFKLNVEMKNAIDGELVPFYQIHDSRYMLYWLALSKNGYQSYIDSLSAIENQKIILSQRSTDFVSPGEQQPEADHFMQSEKSNSGNDHNEFFRNASNGGFFSYELKTQGVEKLSVYVKYWGVNHWGTKIFDILVDDVKIATVNNTNRWNQSQFKTIEYPIPEELLKDKKSVRIKFQTSQGTEVGGIYDLRLVKEL